MTALRERLGRAAVAVAAGLAAPHIELWVKCRAPASEACVWGRSFLPLTVPAYLVVVGGLTYAVLALVDRARRKRGDAEDE